MERFSRISNVNLHEVFDVYGNSDFSRVCKVARERTFDTLLDRFEASGRRAHEDLDPRDGYDPTALSSHGRDGEEYLLLVDGEGGCRLWRQDA